MMCALIGFRIESDNNHHLKVSKYFNILKERGDQSYGYITRELDGTVYYAKSLSITTIVKDIEKMSMGTWVFVHARKASAGMAGNTIADKLARAHPVESDDGSILLLHNGTKASIKQTVMGSLSDSQGLATLLSIAWEGRRTYLGDIGVVIYERKGEIYVYKDGIRPLVMSEDNTIFASEPISDEVKWANIENTYSYGNDSSTDIVLDFSKENLGLKTSALTAIKFKLATSTIANYSVKGMPRSTFCTKCKKSHLDNDKTDICCVCSIVENIETKITYPTSRKFIGGKSKLTNQKVVVVTPDALKAKGVVFQTTNQTAASYQLELFMCDSNLARRAGIITGTWQGTAIVKANYIFRSDLGLLFVLPDPDGKYFVKVDRVFISNTATEARKLYSTKVGRSIPMLGNSLHGNVITLKENVDISKAIPKREDAFAFSTSVYKRTVGKLEYVSTASFNKMKKINCKIKE